MRPGIYYRGELPCEYEDIDAINVSRLVWAATSLKHFKRCPKRTTKALALGTTAHAAVLEPDRFASDFVPWSKRTENDNASPRRGKDWEAFVAAHPGKVIVPRADYDAAIDIRDAIWSEAECAAAIVGAKTEVALVWNHPATGLLCKGRIDWAKIVPQRRPSFGDVKTARDISPGPFFREAARLHYHTKLAWYADALRLLTNSEEDPETLVLAVESGLIHDSVVYEMDEEDLQAGRNEYEMLMARVKQAIDTDHFPGVGNGERQPYFIPKFARTDPEDELDPELDFSKEEAE